MSESLLFNANSAIFSYMKIAELVLNNNDSLIKLK